ncbi:hypothetical protein J2W51_003393 [Tardiphaga robiniae]|uniref:hypothetical protein n=1 Tax=Tardiphaga robiniae TaxID=943830 RepID=UPI002863C2FB|nr:hypothetical protein [Tardiphaga robiniae]MDR6660823.1 hypothetical protein [Tardiphaga robiniae]
MTIKTQNQKTLRRLKGRPAAIFLKASCAFSAAVVEQLHADVFPDRMGSVETHSIDGSDFNDPITATAGYSQDVPGNFG